jgi:hypothetical protein
MDVVHSFSTWYSGWALFGAVLTNRFSDSFGRLRYELQSTNQVLWTSLIVCTIHIAEMFLEHINTDMANSMTSSSPSTGCRGVLQVIHSPLWV